ncbi:MAG TPA: hypothetical protein VFS54_04885 [Solirubrobacterales bacterium]|nr:hypothetical protein [Solirubrobacterales bacterium]
MLLFAERRGHRRIATASATIALALIALLAFSHRAEAAELLYWDNYSATPQTISVANGDGSAGGLLNLTGTTLSDPEGMAIDTVTGRLFVASSNGGGGTGQILAVNLNGSGANVFSAPGALVDEPYGVVLDPATRIIYWANAGSGDSENGSIAWAKLDGSSGGLLNTAGALVANPYKIGLDPVNGRVYWGNHPKGGEESISFANVNNTGGGNLSLSRPPDSSYAFAVDSAAGRLYWSEGQQDRFAYTGLLGGTVNTLDTSGAVVDSSYGFAVDPTLNKISWPNYGNDENPVNGLGFASLSGGSGGNISPTAPFNGPQDLLVLKSPTGTAAPAIARNAKNRAALSCSTGGWAADFAGGYVYQAPTTYAYQWLRNGRPVAGATAATLAAKSAGSYSCTVTAANQAGSATQTSAATTVKAAKVKLTTKKKGKGEPGNQVTFKVKAVNQGDLKPKSAKVCVKLPKASKADLKAPKCKKLVQLEGRAKKTVTIKVKVKPGAEEGTDKLTFQVKGAAGKAAKSKIVVK